MTWYMWHFLRRHKLGWHVQLVFHIFAFFFRDRCIAGVYVLYWNIILTLSVYLHGNVQYPNDVTFTYLWYFSSYPYHPYHLSTHSVWLNKLISILKPWIHLCEWYKRWILWLTNSLLSTYYPMQLNIFPAVMTYRIGIIHRSSVQVVAR